MKKVLILSLIIAQYAIAAMASESVALQNNVKNPMKLFFLGESCAGKTTLMNQLCILSKDFYMPIFTVTRNQREDDNSELFEYVTVEEYLECRKNNEFIFDMDDGKTYYGYKKKHLNTCDKHALLYSSPFFVDVSKKIENSLSILIETDNQQGFTYRQDSESLKEIRLKSNQHLTKEFFSQTNFREKMNLVFYNQFGDIALSAASLLRALQLQIKPYVK